jgi:hypothetical protein
MPRVLLQLATFREGILNMGNEIQRCYSGLGQRQDQSQATSLGREFVEA